MQGSRKAYDRSRYVCKPCDRRYRTMPASKQDPPEAHDIAALSVAVRGLLDRFFVPVATIGVAGLLLSTAELHHQIEEHSPGLVPVGALREVLLSLGFVEAYTGEGFVWLLDRR